MNEKLRELIKERRDLADEMAAVPPDLRKGRKEFKILFDDEFIGLLLEEYPDKNQEWLAKNNMLVAVSRAYMHQCIKRYKSEMARRLNISNPVRAARFLEGRELQKVLSSTSVSAFHALDDRDKALIRASAGKFAEIQNMGAVGVMVMFAALGRFMVQLDGAGTS